MGGRRSEDGAQRFTPTSVVGAGSAVATEGGGREKGRNCETNPTVCGAQLHIEMLVGQWIMYFWMDDFSVVRPPRNWLRLGLSRPVYASVRGPKRHGLVSKLWRKPASGFGLATCMELIAH